MKCHPLVLAGLLASAIMLAACRPTPQAADTRDHGVSRADEDRAQPLPPPVAHAPTVTTGDAAVPSTATSAPHQKSSTSPTAAHAAHPPLAPAAPATVATATAPPVQLIAGSQLVVDDSVVLYSPDARLQFDTGAVVSTTTGVLLSDPERMIVGGDLAIETPQGFRMEADDAIIETSGPHKHVMTGKSVRLSGPVLRPADPPGNPPPAP